VFGFGGLGQKYEMGNSLQGRISGVFRGVYQVIMLDGDEVSCRLTSKCDEPTVGDFVKLDANSDIVQVLPRQNLIARKASGSKHKAQLMAANVDYAFIVTSLNADFNVRRLERYISFLDLQGINHYIILTKSDLCEDVGAYTAQLSDINSPTITTSVVTGCGLDKLSALLVSGKTAVFMGSSGVGKSSIINFLLGEDLMEVDGLRNDDKGRHTTTHRQMFMMPSGAAIIDIPGIRELQIWSGGDVASSFEDIEELAQNRKFRNCSHESEPGCAVVGNVDAKRLKSYFKLQREAKRASGR